MGYSEVNLSAGRQAILKTLIYSDIFDFPLTKKEIWKFLISPKLIQRTVFDDSLKKLIGKEISGKSGYLCLKGRDEIFHKRKVNLQEVEKKLQIGKIAAKYLSSIQSILFIGLSGGLAMNDVEPQDDIDFFIITKSGSIYESRFWILIILQILGLRRTRDDKNTANKICVNFFVDETKLMFPKEKQDIYLAHEIAQIKPLFERDNTYSKLLRSNEWIRKFLPNTIYPNGKNIDEVKNNKKNRLFRFEKIFRTIQIAYMKKSKNRKNITESILIFHSNDYRVQVLKKMRLKMYKLGLLTKI